MENTSEVFTKGLKKECCGCFFWLCWERLKKNMDIDSGEILRRWEGCRKLCGLDVLRGLCECKGK